MTGLPYNTRVEVAFTTGAISATPVWVDVTPYVLSIQTRRGRDYMTDGIEPGTCTVELNNADGRFSPSFPGSPYAGNLKANRKVRVSAQQTSTSTRQYLWTGYADAWKPRLMGDGRSLATCTLTATDRFKLLNRRTNTGSTPTENAQTRIKRILDNGNTDGPNCIIRTAEYILNAGAYSQYFMQSAPYTGTPTLQNLNDVAQADGGAMFMRGDGVLIFQSSGYRNTDALATVSQATFGNYGTGALPCTLASVPSVDEAWNTNRVVVTAYDGTVGVHEDTVAQGNDGILELALSQTLLVNTDAVLRATEIYNRRHDPGPRFDALSIDCYASANALTQALTREISDRVTVNLIERGLPSGQSAALFVERIQHAIGPDRWLTTFALSPTGTGPTTIP